MASTPKREIGELLHHINKGVTNSSTPLGDVMRLCLRLVGQLPSPVRL